MTDRSVSITVREFQVMLLVEALRREVDRLRDLASVERDRANRDGWALHELKARALRDLYGELVNLRDEWGALSPAANTALAERLTRLRTKMPRSKANAAALRAERDGAAERAP